MPRSHTDVLSAFKSIEGLGSHEAKKEAVFGTIHGWLAADVAAAQALGATAAMLAPFTETMAHFAAHKAAIVATDLL